MYSGTEKTAERVSKAPCGRAERRGAFWGLLASFNAVTGDRAGGGGGDGTRASGETTVLPSLQSKSCPLSLSDSKQRAHVSLARAKF